MTIKHLEKTPWPWFGGKADAAPAVWAALGDVDHYVEPFAGSLAVLLRRPHECNRTYHSETVCDIDGLLVNAWRSMQMSPDAMAEAASWPVSEADLHARHLALIKWKAEHQLEHLMGDPLWHDPLMAGWWAWGQCCWIGGGWCSGKGPWIVGADGRITKREKGDPGVAVQIPHLSNDGQGVNRPQASEPGVKRERPHIGDNGRCVNRPQASEPGVKRRKPHIGNNGQGVNHAGTREPGVKRRKPYLSDDGRGVNHAGTREPGVGDNPYHPMTMPELKRWFQFLSARLRHVRILNGDWHRAVTGGATKMITIRMGDGHCGIFLDPPYADTASRDTDLYAEDSTTVAHDVREWAIENGDDPKLRIVLACFEGEHDMPSTWTCVEWFKKGFLKGGMAQLGKNGHQQERERLWLSPHCLTAKPKSTALLDAMEQT